jgi:hypothetical protein
MKRNLLLTMTVAAAVLAAGPALAGQTVSTTHSMPVRLQANLETSGCDNAPGPFITLSGAILLDGVSADLIFRNNAKGTHTSTVRKDVDVVLLPDGQAITIPKQPVQGGTGGNPFIWIQVLDGNGQPLTQEIFLGRCVQGLSTVSADFFLAATSSADITVGGCSNKGPEIELSGEVALSGIKARLIFRNNDNPVGGPHSADEDVTVDIIILPEGDSIVLPKQPVLGGVGGNPLISVQFIDGAGDPISDEFKLGRCVQLAQ